MSYRLDSKSFSPVVALSEWTKCSAFIPATNHPPPLSTYRDFFIADFSVFAFFGLLAVVLFRLPGLRTHYNKLSPYAQLDLKSRVTSFVNAAGLVLAPSMWKMIYCDWANAIGWDFKWKSPTGMMPTFNGNFSEVSTLDASAVLSADQSHQHFVSQLQYDLSRTLFSVDPVRTRLLIWMVAYIAFDMFIVFGLMISDMDSPSTTKVTKSSKDRNTSHKAGRKSSLRINFTSEVIANIIHHFTIFTAIPTGIHYGFGTRYMASLFVNEVSTIFLNIRCSLLTLGVKSSSSSRRCPPGETFSPVVYRRLQKILEYSEIAFAISFFICRTVWIPIILLHLTNITLLNLGTVLDHPLVAVRNIPRWVMVFQIACGFMHGLLNGYWGYLIMKKVYRIVVSKNHNGKHVVDNQKKIR